MPYVKPRINGVEVEDDVFQYSTQDGEYVDSFGNTCHKKDGMFHREGGPAIIHANGQQEWFTKGYRHRPALEGPAIVYPNGKGDYWQDGKRLKELAQWLLNRSWGKKVFFLLNRSFLKRLFFQ